MQFRNIIEVQRIPCFTSPLQVQVKWLQHLKAFPTGIQLLDGDQYRMAGISKLPARPKIHRQTDESVGKKVGGGSKEQ